MIEFLVALAIFILSHALPARSGLRDRLAASIGERGYLVLYSLLSIGLLAWLISAALRAPYIPLWDLQVWHYHVPLALMVPASMLFVGGAISANPLSISFSRDDYDRRRPGLVGITRHPILWAFALWSFAHVVPNGDLVSVIMFGGFGLFALGGMAVVDRRKRRAMGAQWREIAAGTSVIPFLALMSGRASWRWKPGPFLLTVVIGAGLYVALIRFHPIVFGVDPAAVLG